MKKLKLYILPFADILAWCLLPNHFHLMVHINNSEILISDKMTENREITKSRSINNSIAILLRSYTRAIQKQKNYTGSLFQSRTKAICLTEVSGVTPSWFQTNYGASINITNPEKDYPQVCFNYIHNNPVNMGLVTHPKNWEFSSYRDFTGERNGTLINRKRVMEFGLNVNVLSG